jgi:flagellar protein FliL
MAEKKQGAAPAATATPATPAAAEAPATARKKPSKKLLLLVALGLLLAGGAAAAYLLIGKKPADATAEATKNKEAPHKLPSFVEVEPFTVNLAEKEQDRYMQIRFSLEVASGDAENTIREMIPALRSEILLSLSSRSVADLATREGKENLAKDIVTAANKGLEHTAAENSVSAVRITQLIIQ